MTTDRERTDNELIAEFMGYHVVNSGPLIGAPEAQLMSARIAERYAKSWDALMPVVQKIFEAYLQLPVRRDAIIIISNLQKALTTADINAVRTQSLNFIKWYKTQNQKAL